jgi:hypothetical protein
MQPTGKALAAVRADADASVPTSEAPPPPKMAWQKPSLPPPINLADITPEDAAADVFISLEPALDAPAGNGTPSEAASLAGQQPPQQPPQQQQQQSGMRQQQQGRGGPSGDFGGRGRGRRGGGESRGRGYRCAPPYSMSSIRPLQCRNAIFVTVLVIACHEVDRIVRVENEPCTHRLCLEVRSCGWLEQFRRFGELE